VSRTAPRRATCCDGAEQRSDGPGMRTKGGRSGLNARGTRVARGLQRSTLSLETQMTLNPDRIGDLVVRMQGDFLDAPTLTLRPPERPAP
jgi:hypothetical protein